MSNMRSYWVSIQKQASAGIWKRILETQWLQKNNQGRPCKREISYDKPSAFEIMGKIMGNF